MFRELLADVPGRALEHEVLIARDGAPAEIRVEAAEPPALCELLLRMRGIEDRNIKGEV